MKTILTEYLDYHPNVQTLEKNTEVVVERTENKKRKVAFMGIEVEGDSPKESSILKNIVKPDIQLKHFTNTENRIITQLINAYAAEFDVEISEINRETATERSKASRKNHSLLWDRICDALPNKTRVVSYKLIHYHLMWDLIIVFNYDIKRRSCLGAPKL